MKRKKQIARWIIDWLKVEFHCLWNVFSNLKGQDHRFESKSIYKREGINLTLNEHIKHLNNGTEAANGKLEEVFYHCTCGYLKERFDNSKYKEAFDVMEEEKDFKTEENFNE